MSSKSKKRMDEMDKMQIKIIRSLAKNNLNASETARELHYHRNTLIYQINKIERQTGKCPTNFYDLCDLLKTLED